MKKIVDDCSTRILLEGEEPKDICKLGQMSKCCAFLVMGSEGFECIKMYPPMSFTISKRLRDGTMNAKGKGEWKGCPWEDQSTKT